MFNELPESPREVLLRERGRTKTHSGRHALRDEIRFLCLLAERGELPQGDLPGIALRDTGNVADGFRERPVGDPLPIRKAASFGYLRTGTYPRQEFGDEPCFADACLTGDRREHAS